MIDLPFHTVGSTLGDLIRAEEREVARALAAAHETARAIQADIDRREAERTGAPE